MKRRSLFLSSTVVIFAMLLWVQNPLSFTASGQGPLPTATPQNGTNLPARPDPWLEEPSTGSQVYDAETPRESPSVPEGLAVLGQPAETASGLSFSCARFDNGKVYCWGDNQWGQLGNGSFVSSTTPVQVNGLSDAASIATLHKHVCALTRDGAVKCWGRNYHGELGNNSTTNRSTPVDVVGLSGGVKQLAVGGFHACALLEDGGIKCWGYNFHGQLGDGTSGETADRWTPVDVVDAAGARLTGFRAIALGKYHACALTSANRLQCWGYNMDGQVGDGTSGREADRHTPVDVPGLTDVRAVALGERHSCALLNAGSVKCWGGGYEGQLGFIPENWQTSIPTDVPGLTSGVSQIVAGVYHSCAILSNAALQCWGNNYAGQVGNGSMADQYSPQPVVGAESAVSQVSGGDSHTCAVIDQQVSCWGSNLFGQVGNGQTGLYAPTQPTGLDGRAIAVASGAYHSCAILEGGSVKCWGRNTFGQLGDGTNEQRLTAVDVVGLDVPAVAVTAGGNHSCVLLADNRVMCWGLNGYGQLGNGQAPSSNLPVKVVTENEEEVMEGTIHEITGGWEHTCAVADVGFWCWGGNTLGQLGNDKAPQNSSIPVSVRRFGGETGVGIVAGENNTCAFTAYGVAKCWGDNFYGQLGIGITTTSEVPLPIPDLQWGVTDMAVGRYHACAMVDGGAKCWGFNASGQVGDRTTVNRWSPVDVSGLPDGVVAIRAGGLSTCALLSDGRVKCWGDNGFAQLGDETTFSRSVPVDVLSLEASRDVSLGMRHACALSVTGVVACWGANDFGQIGNNSLPFQLTPLQLPTWYLAQLATNFTGGQPDSYFTLSGIDYPPGVTVTIRVNAHVFTQTVTADATGAFTFQLHVPAGEEGYYAVQTQAAGYTAGLLLQVNAGEPLRPRLADEFLEVPTGIVAPYAAFIPLIAKAP
ncbi:MAG: RCC1 repeat-containing protein [Chloroflexota bacterium]